MENQSNPSKPASTAQPSIEQCFHAEETPLLRYAYGLVKRREVAEEVVQEAFMRLHQHWGEVEHARAWLYRAVRNLALNYLRKHQRETLSEEGDFQPDSHQPDEQAVRLEAASNVRRLIAEMPDSDRELIRLKFEENLSYAHISEKLELGVGNVGYRLHHLLKTLGDSLRRAGVEGSRG